MMKIKTSELTGLALRYAVCLARADEGYRPYHNYMGRDGWEVVWGEAKFGSERAWLRHWNIEEDWSQGGPIIEREGVTITMRYGEGTGGNGRWAASIGPYPTKQVTGPTPLIAAMRCFVASRLGDEVDVPEELLK
jgi:hypothetical protein